MLPRADVARTAAVAAARRSYGKFAMTVTRRCLSPSNSMRLHPRGFLPAFVEFNQRVRKGKKLLSFGGGVGDVRRNSSSSTSPIVFVAPPEELEDGYLERPTPLLLVAGEGQPASWWSDMASFLTARGCTVGTMALTGRGSSPTDILTLRALQAGIAAAVDASCFTPPVIIAHSMAGFVCQQYLQSYSASGLVLLDSFPPCPSTLANEHLLLACATDPHQPNHPAGPSANLSAQELARMMKENTPRWEGYLRRYFTQLHRRSPWQDLTLPREGHNKRSGSERKSTSASSSHARFPVMAFAQMCLGQPASTLRLETRAVETLVLGSAVGAASNTAESLAGVTSVLDRVVALDGARRDGLDAICEFHGVDGWSMVDHRGLVRDGVGDGEGEHESVAPWQEAIWKWYDTRF